MYMGDGRERKYVVKLLLRSEILRTNTLWSPVIGKDVTFYFYPNVVEEKFRREPRETRILRSTRGIVPETKYSRGLTSVTLPQITCSTKTIQEPYLGTRYRPFPRPHSYLSSLVPTSTVVGTGRGTPRNLDLTRSRNRE